MVIPHRSDRGGFTLLEAVVSLLISTVVVMMATSVFLVQNEFYSDVVRRSALHESVRFATSRVTAELQGIAAGGIVTAEANRVVYRFPIAVGGVCGVGIGEVYVHFPFGGGISVADEAAVVGYSVRDTLGGWTYQEEGWRAFEKPQGTTAIDACIAAGADTVGATGDFFLLEDLIATPAIQLGDLVMIYQELELQIATSALDSESTGVFWGPVGETLTEASHNLSPNSAFEYRLSSSTTFQSSVTGGDLSNIVAIRFRARGSMPASRGGRDPLTFDLTASVPLGNAY
jgi:hypothetical protein